MDTVEWDLVADVGLWLEAITTQAAERLAVIDRCLTEATDPILRLRLQQARIDVAVVLS